MSVPPRLHVALARESPRALIIAWRTRRFRLIAWDRRNDLLEKGPFMDGTVYPDGADIAPDGRHAVWSAANYAHWDKVRTEAWTSISRLPDLTALAIYPHGIKGYSGLGGYFVSATEWRSWGSRSHDGEKPVDESGLVRLGPRMREDGTFAERGYYAERLNRNGWSLVPAALFPDRATTFIFERQISDRWRLRKTLRPKSAGRGRINEEIALIGPGGETVMPDWEWADADGARLYYALAGKIWAQETRTQPWPAAQPILDLSGCL